MVAIAQEVQAPTMAAAKAAGEALVAAGVGEVLLFGSVARGSATEYSDIDLVAVFDDIDYTQRPEMARRLEDTARDAVGAWPVQVFVTDRPEWRNRVEKVSGSFESAICREAVRVAGARRRGRVRWDKEMVLPMSNPDEALKQFTERVLPRVEAMTSASDPTRRELDLSAPIEVRETARLRRMVRVCTESAMTVELALKALAVLRTVPTPPTRALRGAGHSISACLLLLHPSVRVPVEGLVTRRGLSTEDLSGWRIDSTYPEEIAKVYQKADQRPDAYVDTALDVCDFVIGHFRAIAGDTPGIRAAEDELRRAVTDLADRDIRTGQTTPAAVAELDLGL